MKTFKIAHLYYDLMNLYGENGNIRYLKQALEEQDMKVEIHFLTINDQIDFNKYDFFYMGMGSSDNQNIVLNDILKYKKEIKEAINNGKYFLITGNSLDLFGKSITKNNQEYQALNTFNYFVIEEEFRIVGPQYYNCKLLNNHNIIGFTNRNSLLKDGYNPLFNVIEGTGCTIDKEDTNEGFKEKNFYGTYLLGPLLVRNPFFTDYLVKNICKQNNIKYKEPNQNNFAYKAYYEYIKNFYQDK